MAYLLMWVVGIFLDQVVIIYCSVFLTNVITWTSQARRVCGGGHVSLHENMEDVWRSIFWALTMLWKAFSRQRCTSMYDTTSMDLESRLISTIFSCAPRSNLLRAPSVCPRSTTGWALSLT